MAINGMGRFGVRNYVSSIPQTTYFFPSGMVSSYSANGSFNDSTSSNNLTAYNGAVSNSTAKLGSGGFGFDGINDSLATSTNLFEYQEFSYSFWMSASNVGGGLLTNQYGGSAFRFKIDDYENKFFMRRFAASGFYDITTSVCFSLNTYNHVVITRDNVSGTKIYCNNSLVGTDTNTSNTLYGGGRLRIGGDVDYSYISPLNGKMDSIQIFNKALSTIEISGLYNSGIGREVLTTTPTYTTRTTAFATATGITDTTILNALSTFDTGLISNGLDTKMKALYPFVGGTANAHKFNFMDARDLNVAYRLSFNGGWVHSNTGALPNGTNTFANTYLNGTNLNLYNTHLSYYSRTQSLQALNIEMGADKNPNTNQLLCLVLPRNTGSAYALHTSQVSTNQAESTGQTITKGLFINNRNGSLATDLKLIRNSTILSTATTNGTNIISAIGNVYIGALNNDPNSGQFFSNKEVAFSSIGNGLTDGEATIFYTLTQALQTSLSRQV